MVQSYIALQLRRPTGWGARLD